MKNEKVGVIYSITPETISKIKTIPSSFIFIKFQAHETIPDFSEKAKLFLYKSHSNKEIIGRGNIESATLLTEKEILKKYLRSILLSKDKLREYVGYRKDKRLLVIKVKNFKNFEKGIPSKLNITMAGKLLSQEEYNLLFKE